jgi:hypothetical protein
VKQTNNKFVYAHDIYLMPIFSPSGAGGDMYKPYIFVLLSLTLQPVEFLRNEPL